MISRAIKNTLRRIARLFTDTYIVNVSDVQESDVLKEKIILLTGSTGGLGKEFSKAFLKSGAYVILCARNTEKLQSLKKELLEINSNYSKRISLFELDQNNFSEYQTKFLEAVRIFGRIDCLVNNAGIMGATIPNAEIKAYDSVLDTNLKSVFFPFANCNQIF